MQLGRSNDAPWNILLPHSHYAEELKQAPLSDYVPKGRMLGGPKLRTSILKALGALLWIHQSRPDVGFDIAKIDTDDVPSCPDATMALQTLSLYNRVVRYVQNYDREIPYSSASLSRRGSFLSRFAKFRQLRLAVFPDDGFCTFPKNSSVECHIAVLAEVGSRDGLIQRTGSLIDYRCAKIPCVCRSALVAD